MKRIRWRWRRWWAAVRVAHTRTDLAYALAARDLQRERWNPPP